ncbi:glycosyltransferase [bacterium]|nr:glycosyltransferase [bacterium]
MKKNNNLDILNYRNDGLSIEVKKYPTDSKLVFSIVIPYYDTFDTINETLDSIATQTFNLKKVEVIIVSDGAKISIDNLVKPYQKKFGNFKLIKKANGN